MLNLPGARSQRVSTSNGSSAFATTPPCETTTPYDSTVSSSTFHRDRVAAATLRPASNCGSYWTADGACIWAISASRPPTQLRSATGGHVRSASAQPLQGHFVPPSCPCKHDP